MNDQQYRPRGFSYLPPAVKNLLIINGIFYLATIALQRMQGFDLTDLLGLHYFSAEEFYPFQFITYMFMHGSFTHILFNMFALWMFGYLLENVWGAKRFLLYYFVTGIGAALVHYGVLYFEVTPTIHAVNEFLDAPTIESFKQFYESGDFKVVNQEMFANAQAFEAKYNILVQDNPQQALQEAINFSAEYKRDFMNAPVVVGASGAVFGILLAFGMMFPNSLIYIYFLFPIRAKWFVIIYGAIELFSGISSVSGYHSTNVAHFAHLGGMLFGFFLIRYWNKKLRNRFY